MRLRSKDVLFGFMKQEPKLFLYLVWFDEIKGYGKENGEGNDSKCMHD